MKVKVTTDLLISLYNKVDNLYPWQTRWYNHRFERNRYLHKGRQIGGSYFFVLEGLLDASLTGRNKIYISHNYDLDNEFISNEMEFVKCFLGIESNAPIPKIELDNGAVLYFLPENRKSWVDIIGDIYVSEWSWFQDPSYIVSLVKSMSLNKKWRRTFYSSRSKSDNGHIADNDYFKHHKIFDEETYWDVVPSINREFYNFLNMENIRNDRGDDYFNEMMLCQLNGDY
ncbi:terminase family protein [Proteus mirabilis]|uniref:terminase large subunit domain-containing protein n=2 Tax=Proteus mirabilis TaxID=584 RepID=UPI00217DEF98|nr:terminase family protein [Proteus mirabilis]MCS6720509.1 terminase family protein [Proteus mirabilis]MCS6736146.1 terminase family protein [Proteus mirabilis]